MTPPTLALGALAAAALGVAVAFPAFAGGYYVRLATGIYMFGALASAWNLVGGYTGYPDFGGAAFLGIGAYTTGILMLRAHLPFAAALGAGGALAVLAAVGMGTLLLRLRGHYFAIATLGFMLVLRQVAANLPITGGGPGTRSPRSGRTRMPRRSWGSSPSPTRSWRTPQTRSSSARSEGSTRTGSRSSIRPRCSTSTSPSRPWS